MSQCALTVEIQCGKDYASSPAHTRKGQGERLISNRKGRIHSRIRVGVGIRPSFTAGQAY
uniref:Uncharacterized protein n=1 Tax=Utricularia reniformis TaxID=192314 RepID=A0A1Y0B1G8_9LAMI|nr:hypothetical protein AEK19_MT1073 [Utricularia reniformis]ART31295.1 hypothetical protein AEK19_MT1073 [Utricularia reniformis]